MEDRCSVKNCRQMPEISHQPLKVRLCKTHWGAHCDGQKLEFVEVNEVQEDMADEKQPAERAVYEILESCSGKKGRAFVKGEKLKLRCKIGDELVKDGKAKRL